MGDITTKWTVRYDNWPKISRDLDKKAEAIAAKAALDIEAGAKTRAPVDTGTLKNSIQATRTGKARWRIVVGAHYGMYVEWGTSRMAAQPYFQPAVNLVRPQFIAALKAITS